MSHVWTTSHKERNNTSLNQNESNKESGKRFQNLDDGWWNFENRRLSSNWGGWWRSLDFGDFCFLFRDFSFWFFCKLKKKDTLNNYYLYVSFHVWIHKGKINWEKPRSRERERIQQTREKCRAIDYVPDRPIHIRNVLIIYKLYPCSFALFIFADTNFFFWIFNNKISVVKICLSVQRGSLDIHITNNHRVTVNGTF